jgi:hypothetical protein
MDAVSRFEPRVSDREVGRASRFELAYVVVVAAGFAAPALSFAQLPWAHRDVALLGAVLLLVPALLVSLVVGALCRFGARRWSSHRTVAWGCTVASGATVVLVGAYLANVLLVDPPTSGKTLHGYAVTLLCAGATMVVVARVSRARRGWEALRRVGARRVVAVLGLVLGIVCATADAALLPHFYYWHHLAIAGLSLAGFALAVHCQRPDALRQGRIVLATIGGLWIVVTLVAGRLDDATAEIVRHATVHRRAWTLAHRVWSGGTLLRLPEPSCDGVERTIGGPRPDPGPTASVVGPSELGPQLLVLVTIDAFRCGFGQRDRDELREACPELTKLLATSSYRLDAHAISPATASSTSAMQLVDGGERLGDRLRAVGLDSTVIVTHRRILAGPGVRASFDHIDDVLAPRAESGIATTSEETTDRALAALRAMAADRRRHFLWVHYFDPHDPYVEDPASPWRRSSLRAYAAEVRRTDSAVARLIAAVQRELPASAVLVLTADHGEAFGEHRSTFHGATLYDETTRIPLAVWANDDAQRRALPANLPVGSSEIGRYLVAVATRAPFATSAQTRLFVDTPEDEQRGLVDDRGWKLIEHRSLGYTELFDLRSDPTEEHDLTRERPDMLLEMRCRLARSE